MEAYTGCTPCKATLTNLTAASYIFHRILDANSGLIKLPPQIGQLSSLVDMWVKEQYCQLPNDKPGVFEKHKSETTVFRTRFFT